MRSVLFNLTSKFRAEDAAPKGPDVRLDKVVARQRAGLEAAAQKKLSVQVTDPVAEETTEPLYDVSVYVSPPEAS